MTTESPVSRERHFYVGVGTFIRYRNGREEFFTSSPAQGRGSHVSFTDLLTFSLIVVFWGFVILAGYLVAVGGPA